MAVALTIRIQTELWLICLHVLAIVVWPSTAVSDIHFQILEEESVGSYVGDIRSGWDISPDHSADYQFGIDLARTDDNARDRFQVEATTGILSTAQVLDRDTLCSFQNSCTLSLGITIVSSSRLESLSVSVVIIDINDNRPWFPHATESVGIPESTIVNTLLPLTEAIDYDSGMNGLQSYALQPESDQFNIVTEANLDGSMDVQLIVLAPLDRELQDSYSFTLIASDAGNPILSSSMILNITIVDINDNIASFTQDEYEFSVEENTPISDVVATVEAFDPDKGANGHVLYEFSTRTQAQYGDTFAINQNGEITLSKALDYESRVSYELTVSARDSAPNAQNSFAKVTINVIDVNDFPPQITVTTLPNSAQAEVVENSPVDTFIAHVTVIDRDTGTSGQVSCSLDNDRFQLQNDEGENTQFRLVTAFRFDRELISSDRVTVICRDQGSPRLTSEEVIDVTIKDTNDNDPAFDKALYSVVLQENDASGIYVTTVTARDADYGVNAVIEYKIEEPEARSGFEINNNGMITAIMPLDHEAQQVISFHISATDGGSPSRSSMTAVQIQLVDMNDSPPVFTPNTFPFAVVENQPAGVDIGHLVATDADSSPYDIINYAFESDAFALRALFDLDTNSGRIRSKVPYDRETMDMYTFQVVAYNPSLPRLNATATVTISIDDLNDMDPMFIFPSTENHTLQISSNLREGELVVQVRAIDLDLGNNAWLSFSIENGNNDGYFAINENTGIVTITQDISKSSQKNFNLSIQARDHGNPARFTRETLMIWATGARVDSSKDEGFTNNMIILICLVSISGILVVLLLFAILWLVYKSRYRKSKKAKYYQRNPSDENLGPKVEIIERLDTLTTGDLNTSFKDQHFYDLHQKPVGGREGPLNSHNSADSGFDEHHDVTFSQHGRHVSFKMDPHKPQDTIDELDEPVHAGYNDHQPFDASSTSSEEGSNTDSGCVLSEGSPDPHDQQPQVPQRTYPLASKPGANSKTHSKIHPSHSGPSTSHKDPASARPRSKSESSSSEKRSHNKGSSVKLRYVDTNWPDVCHSGKRNSGECSVGAMKNGASIVRNFSDSNSILRYKSRNPSAHRCASEMTDNSSSTSGSYILTTDEHGATAC